MAATRHVDELALNRCSSSWSADVDSAVRVAGSIPTLGGGMRARRNSGELV
jgi:hypothetical protein